MMEQTKQALDENGIEIPYHKVDVLSLIHI